VARRLDEVKASVNTVVDHLLTVHSVLLLEICIEASLDVFNDRFPAVVVVDKITETGCINNGKTQSHAIFLDV
jgi:hypothetical protein